MSISAYTQLVIYIYIYKTWLLVPCWYKKLEEEHMSAIMGMVESGDRSLRWYKMLSVDVGGLWSGFAISETHVEWVIILKKSPKRYLLISR